jgi:hypothetical protein
MTPSKPIGRTLIFISHATPQDNDFTLWLGARLASAGYSVWSDVTKLIGGETHWDNIEAAVREHAIKVVSVCSTISVTKKGFKDELSLALAVERQHSLADFVIPVRLDSLAYAEFPTEIIRRNGIDFSEAWQDGLGKLLRKLELDNVPRASATDTDALSAWSKSLLQIDRDISEISETLMGNVLAVIQGPIAINIHQIKTGTSVSPADMLAWPAEIKGQWTISFARLEKSDPTHFEHFSQLDLSHFVESGGGPALSLGRQDPHNIVSSILRQAWGRYAQSKGLLGQGFANGRVGYFLPAEEGGSKRTSFKGPTGISGARALNGFSPKNNVYWHYAPELLPVVGKPLTFSVAPHVIFTEDGKTPLSDTARAHRLRRRFCKSWWQDRWRDMMLAYLAHLAGGKDTLEIPLSESFSLVLDAHPALFDCPVTAAAPIAEPQDDEADDPAIDEHDADDEESPEMDAEEYPR